MVDGLPPVILVPYDPEWPAMFGREQIALQGVLRPWLVGPIEHIGSTSVEGLSAKPIIDIMAGVESLESSVPALEALSELSYCYFLYKAGEMHWLCKPSDFARTHHLHLVPFESPVWRARLAFRDHLRRDPVAAHRYLTLKRDLADRFREDREAYTEGKSDFIESMLRGSI